MWGLAFSVSIDVVKGGGTIIDSIRHHRMDIKIKFFLYEIEMRGFHETIASIFCQFFCIPPLKG